MIFVAFLLPAKTPMPWAISKIGSRINTSLFSAFPYMLLLSAESFVHPESVPGGLSSGSDHLPRCHRHRMPLHILTEYSPYFQSDINVAAFSIFSSSNVLSNGSSASGVA